MPSPVLQVRFSRRGGRNACTGRRPNLWKGRLIYELCPYCCGCDPVCVGWLWDLALPDTPFPEDRAALRRLPPHARHDITSQTEMTDYESLGQEPPISQFVTTYVLGDDLFDDSFSIDSPSGEFLGECGIGISETIGVGDPKKVQAFEVWLFDKNDIQTVTKVLMSAHAFNDAATFQRLQAKGEPFMVERGKQVVLETAALQLVATVSDAEYGQGALPAESYFDRLTLEIAVWPKVAAPAPATA